jgi:transcriptional regulator with XRE-family HTH domain
MSKLVAAPKLMELDWSKAALQLAGDLVRNKRLALGLRQADLATQIPTSITTVAWLEQGRAFAISDTLLGSFGEALGFNLMEQAFFVGLYKHRPNKTPPVVSGRFWQPFIEPVTGPPLLLTNRCWDVLVRSDPANDEFLQLTTTKPTFHLLEQLLEIIDPMRDEAFIHRQIDQFRIDSIRHIGQTAHTVLVQRLSAKSALFAQRWRSTEFSADELAPAGFKLGELELQVERMEDAKRDVTLHIFRVVR